jgi:LPXTG-motif cell wall-anchored protein
VIIIIAVGGLSIVGGIVGFVIYKKKKSHKS